MVKSIVKKLAMSLTDRILETLDNRRKRILEGDINCIPSPFRRLSNSFPGIEQDKYYLVSGSTKAAKTQITNYLFVYTPILYAYEHPKQLRVKIFYFPLEETPENITLRFMSYLLYTLSGKQIRISPMDLKSTNADKILDEEILNILKSDEYQKILKFYEDNVLFMSARHPTGIYKTIKDYADKNGIIHRKKVKITNKETGNTEEVEAFDYYEPYDKKEYVIIITDHVSLLNQERGMNLRETINKYSEYMMIARNNYHYIPVSVQQQSTETTNLEAFKSNKIRPTMAGLSDSKYTAKDCSVMFGITNPFAFELPEYLGYDISKLRSHARFLEIVLNREGESNDIAPLYFDGATNYFAELPPSKDSVSMQKVYDLIAKLKAPANKVFIAFSTNKMFNFLFKWIK